MAACQSLAMKTQSSPYTLPLTSSCRGASKAARQSSVYRYCKNSQHYHQAQAQDHSVSPGLQQAGYRTCLHILVRKHHQHNRRELTSIRGRDMSMSMSIDASIPGCRHTPHTGQRKCLQAWGKRGDPQTPNLLPCFGEGRTLSQYHGKQCSSWDPARRKITMCKLH